jgi:V/A-type H+/Na+-transporting ATPase subunit E
MGLDQVKQEIQEKAEQEAAAIMREAESEADRIMQEAKEKVAEHKQQAEASTQQVLELLEKRELAAAEFDVKKALLNKKKSMIGNVMEEVKEKLSMLDDATRTSNLKKLLARAKKEIDVHYVYANIKDKSIVKALKVEYKEQALVGGIITENKERTISVDYSYDQMLQEIQDKSLQNIGEKLFE